MSQINIFNLVNVIKFFFLRKGSLVNGGDFHYGEVISMHSYPGAHPAYF